MIIILILAVHDDSSNKPSRNKQVIIESLSFFNNQESDTGYEKRAQFPHSELGNFCTKTHSTPNTPRGKHKRREERADAKKGFLIKSFVPLAIYASVSGPARKWKEERAKMGLQFSSGETFPDIHVAVVVVVVVSLLSSNGAGGIDLGGALRKFTNWMESDALALAVQTYVHRRIYETRKLW